MAKLWTVDAFTREAFRGNPAAVMVVDAFPSDACCSAIAAEMNLSETAFVQPLAPNRYAIRWFTPAVEVKLCGHATLAAAHVLFSEGFIPGEPWVVFDSLSGPLKVVQREAGEYTMEFPLQPVTTSLPLETFRAIFGPSVVAAVKAHDDVLVEVSDLKTLLEGSFDIAKIAEIDTRGVILTGVGHSDYDFVSRFFGPRCGIAEDPVTGSAHCSLADYWSKKLGKESFKAFQASKRSGELQVSIRESRVYLTGSAKTVLDCQLKVDLF